MSKAEAALAAKGAILAGVPDQCQSCIIPRMRARNLGEDVAEGTIAVEEATRSLAEDIGRNCLLGQGVIGGCAGNEVVCGYGGRELTETERIDLHVAIGGDLPVDLLSTDDLLLLALRDANNSSQQEG